jgi:hypothetical protein
VAYEVQAGSIVGKRLAELPYAAEEFALLVGRGNGALMATPDAKLAVGDRIWCLRPRKTTSPIADQLKVVETMPAREAAQVSE